MAIDSIGVLVDHSSVQRQKDGASRDAARLRLERSAYLQLRQVRCHVRSGVLRLLGSVSSYYLRQIAQVTVQGLPGIEAIDNQLEVRLEQVHSRSFSPGLEDSSDEYHS